MHHIPCGYLLLNEQGEILETNEYFLELINYPMEQVVGQFIDQYLSSASKIIFHSLFLMQIIHGGKMEEIYLTLKVKDMEDIPIQLNGKLDIKEGKTYIECVLVTITKRNRYEQELQSVRDELEDAYLVKNEVLAEENRLRELFETILYSIHEGIIVTDKQGKITIMNELAQRYTGWDAKEALGKPFGEVFHTIDIQSRVECEPIIGNELIAKRGHDYIQDVILLAKDGRERYIQGTAAYITQNEHLIGAVTTFRDTTKEYFQENVIDSFLNINMDILCVFDMNMKIHKVNRKFQEILGYEEEELLGKQLAEFVQDSDLNQIKEEFDKMLNFHEVCEFISEFRCKNGSYRIFEWRIQLSMGQYIFASARDVTIKTIENEVLIEKAMRDQLTGLYNRHYLDRMIFEEMTQSDIFNLNLTMAIMDLDLFKLVNDTWGHPVGDDQLKTAAQIAARSVRSTDWLIRFGGEEFVIILPKTSLEEAVKVLENVRLNYENNNHPVTGKQTLSIGAAQKKYNETFQEWYERADEALYSAKMEGRNRVVIR